MTAYHSQAIAHSGVITPLATHDFVCPNCGCNKLSVAHKNSPVKCLTCGNPDIQPILKTAFLNLLNLDR